LPLGPVELFAERQVRIVNREDLSHLDGPEPLEELPTLVERQPDLSA
jgi:hypothetical protein